MIDDVLVELVMVVGPEMPETALRRRRPRAPLRDAPRMVIVPGWLARASWGNEKR
jgi:hypothetical protein